MNLYFTLEWIRESSSVNSTGPLKREIRRPAAGDSCDGGISVLYNCLSWYKFVNYTNLLAAITWAELTTEPSP